MHRRPAQRQSGVGGLGLRRGREQERRSDQDSGDENQPGEHAGTISANIDVMVVGGLRAGGHGRSIAFQAMLIRKASARWQGNLTEGSGTIRTGLGEGNYSFKS